MRRLMVCVLLASFGAILGPRIVGPQSHAAGAPFVYEPPDGLVPLKDSKKAEAEGAKVWTYDDAAGPTGAPGGRSTLVRAILNHSNKVMSVDEADLSKLASEMPKAFEECTWVHRRHEMRVRADGARVGLIEGDCDRELDLGALGLPAQKMRTRKLQLMFPDDAGTSIVTASYPVDQATRWEPLFEATIGKARGVATRAPAPAPWTYAAWAAAGAIVGWLATAIGLRKGNDEPTKVPEPRQKKSERDEDEGEDDDT